LENVFKGVKIISTSQIQSEQKTRQTKSSFQKKKHRGGVDKKWDSPLLRSPSSLFHFLLAGESESQGEAARMHGARAKRGMGGGGGERKKSLQLSPYILPNTVHLRTGGN